MNWKATSRLAIVFVCTLVLMSACSASDKPKSGDAAAPAAQAGDKAAGGAMDKAPATPDDKAPAAKSQGGSMEFEPLDKLKERLKDNGLYAVIDTTQGRIVAKLEPEKTPIGTANFVGLAEGTKEWVDPKTGDKVKRPFYDGLIFHRVIKDFMLQGGCPLGTGTGGPGYQFKNENDPSLKFDAPGVLAYANAGPDTNGSQFFITTVPTQWLNGKHPIFGHVVEGMSTVKMIEAAPTGRGDRPVENIAITKISILRVGESSDTDKAAAPEN